MIRPAVLCHLLLCGALLAQSPSPASNTSKTGSNTTQDQAATTKPASVARSHFRPDPLAGHASRYYRVVWGVEALDVKSAESGEVIRFSYRIVNADKAKTLNDKRLEPALIDERAHVKLSIPIMDKVGKLRQTSTPEDGKIYWMLFSNKGGYVKRGDHVNVVIGSFHANGLVVD